MSDRPSSDRPSSDDRPTTLKIIELRGYYARELTIIADPDSVVHSRPMNEKIFLLIEAHLKNLLRVHEDMVLAPYNEARRRRDEAKKAHYRRDSHSS